MQAYTLRGHAQHRAKPPREARENGTSTEFLVVTASKHTSPTFCFDVDLPLRRPQNVPPQLTPQVVSQLNK